MATGGRKIPGARFYEKKVLIFFSKFIGPVTSIWVLSLPETAHLVLAKRFSTRAVFERSIRVLGWQLGTANSGTMISPKKTSTGCLEITGLVTAIWVLSLTDTIHMVFTERLSASAIFARSIKVLGWQLGAAKFREHDFTKKRS